MLSMEQPIERMSAACSPHWPILRRKPMKYILHYNKAPRIAKVALLRSYASHHSQFSSYGPEVAACALWGSPLRERIMAYDL
jgi:hypothetical protein